MIESHVTDTDIQLYAINPAECSDAVRNHINRCTQCQFETDSYREIFSALKDSSVPDFDFDIYGVAMPRKPTGTSEKYLPLIMSAGVSLFAVVIIAVTYSLIRRARVIDSWHDTGIDRFDFLFVAIASIVVIVSTRSEFRKRDEKINEYLTR